MSFDSRWKNPQGGTVQQLYLWAQDLIKELRSGTYLGPVSSDIGTLQDDVDALETATWEQSWLIEIPDEKDYRVVVNAAVARSITGVTTRSSTGTCTLTVSINSTALGGTANSVSTSEETQTHSSDNDVSIGDDVVLTISSLSGAENVSVTLTGALAGP